ncbi:MAG: carboxypeptidase-like regulatory domain-containing protein, partial [Acidobacteriaceae bacterium]
MRVRHSSAIICTLLAAFTLLPVIRSFAQATTASVHGTVTDPNGVVLANASVAALNTSTGIAVSQKTDSKGYFVFPDLHIGGPYSITVEDSGFQRFVVSGIMLDLSSARQVDARLRIGSSSETVRVSSEEVEVESSDVQLKDVIGAQELEDLPTLGRDAVQLQKTAPGTVEASDREATFSTNGSQTQENSYLLDGTDINDFLLNQPGITVNPDALAEIN